MSAEDDLDAIIAARGGPSKVVPIREPFLPMLSLSELADASKAMRWLVKHTVPADSLGVIFGASGAFKSFVALDLAMHVAHGMKWMGKKTHQGPVIIIAAEGGSGTWRRIHAWHRAHGLLWQDVSNSVRVVPQSVNLSDESSRVRDAAKLVGITPVLVIVDTMSQTIAGEENDATDVTAYLREIGLQIRMVWQCAVVIVHHSGHNATERPRGSSAILANTDFVFGVFRDEAQMLATVECVKQKDGERFSDQSFALHVETLGRDEDGEDITSLYASHVATHTEVVKIMEHEASRGRSGHHMLFIQLAQNGVKEQEVRRAFYEDCGLSNQESCKKAYSRARYWCVKNNILEIINGFVVLRSKE